VKESVIYSVDVTKRSYNEDIFDDYVRTVIKYGISYIIRKFIRETERWTTWKNYLG